MWIQKTITLLLLFSFLLLNCRGPVKDDDPALGQEMDAANDPTVLPVQALRKKVTLEGVYASSNLVENSVLALIDDNPRTFWQSNLGNGPGEKLGFSVQGEGVYVSKLIMAGLKLENNSNISEVAIYVNGDLLGFRNVADTIHIDTIVKKLNIE